MTMRRSDYDFLQTAEDIAEERLGLMASREVCERTETEPGLRPWHLIAAGIDHDITLRAIELGLETDE